MSDLKIHINNLKCRGCAGTIIKNIQNLAGVSQVEVTLEDASVNISGSNLDRSQITKKLSELGYPETGTANNFQHKVKSYVSCAIGRMSNE